MGCAPSHSDWGSGGGCLIPENYKAILHDSWTLNPEKAEIVSEAFVEIFLRSESLKKLFMGLDKLSLQRHQVTFGSFLTTLIKDLQTDPQKAEQRIRVLGLKHNNLGGTEQPFRRENFEVFADSIADAVVRHNAAYAGTEDELRNAWRFLFNGIGGEMRCAMFKQSSRRGSGVPNDLQIGNTIVRRHTREYH